MMAVCAVGPPEAVQRPRMRFGSSWAVSEEVKSSATRITGDRASVVPRARRPRADARRAGRCREVRSSLGEPLVLDLLQLHRTTFNGMLPRPSRTVASINVRGDFLKDLCVVQKRQVRAENRCLTFARLL